MEYNKLIEKRLNELKESGLDATYASIVNLAKSALLLSMLNDHKRIHELGYNPADVVQNVDTIVSLLGMLGWSLDSISDKQMLDRIQEICKKAMEV